MLTHFRFALAGLCGIVVLAIWLHLVFGRGWFWLLRNADADQDAPQTPSAWPDVTAIVPARNEAATIAQTVASLARQDYRGNFSFVVVDDHSNDATATLAKNSAQTHGAAARLQVLSAHALPDGWTGKLWALHSGVLAAELESPAYLWFTDADVTHASDTLTRIVARAEQNHLDLTSLMVLLQSKRLPERALIPAFLYFFLMLYPPRWTADEELNSAGAAGGCVLLKREALRRIGGLAAIRSEVIDDCALARVVKHSGGRVWMGLTRKSSSLRAYNTFAEIRDLIARTAFTQLRYSAALLVGTILGMFLTFGAPVVLLFSHDLSAKLLAAVACFLMLLSFLPAVRFYRLSLLWAPLLPLAALFYSYATWLSAARYWLGKGGQWKGRAQARKVA